MSLARLLHDRWHCKEKWVRFLRQLGGLAKVDLGFVYAANFSSSACVA